MMLIKSGSRFQVRRNPNAPRVNAVVDYVLVEVDDDDRIGVQVTVTLDDPSDTSSRPSEQVTLGVFRFRMWVEFGKEWGQK